MSQAIQPKSGKSGLSRNASEWINPDYIHSASQQSVVVAIPIYRNYLTPSERLALRAMRKVLKSRAVCFVVPHGLRNDEANRIFGSQLHSVKSFSANNFASRRTYSQLLLNKDFFAKFESHQYVLIAQLDALVIRDTLDEWIGREFDFVGSPLRQNYGLSSRSGAGPGMNGGLSLRRIESAMRVLSSRRIRRIRFRVALGMERNPIRFAIRTLRDGLVFNYASTLQVPRINEDLYWSYLVPAAHSWFRVPTQEVAAEFAFDAANLWPMSAQLSSELLGIHAFELLPISVVRDVEMNIFSPRI